MFVPHRRSLISGAPRERRRRRAAPSSRDFPGGSAVYLHRRARWPRGRLDPSFVWQTPAIRSIIRVARVTAGGAARSFVPVCFAAGPGTTLRTTCAAPTATGTTLTTATITSGFGCCVRPTSFRFFQGTAPSGAARVRRVRRADRAASGIARRPRFADRGEEEKMARARPVRTARRR